MVESVEFSYLVDIANHESAAMDDLCAHQAVHPALPKFNDRSGGFDLQVLRQVGDRLNLFGQSMAVTRVSREGSGTNDHALHGSDRNTSLYAELIGVAALAPVDALVI